MHTSSPGALAFNPYLHGLRGIAATAVLLFHWGSGIGFFPQARKELVIEGFGSQWDLGVLLDVGWLGVPLFFVLSGYLLTAQLINRQPGLHTVGHFWKRRVLRIYPAYWAQLAVLLLLASYFAFMPQLRSSGDLVRHLFLWINLPPWMTRPMNLVWWTLPIELGFYLLLPLLVALARRSAWQLIVLGSAIITVSWRYGVMHHFAGEDYARHLAVLDAIPGTLFTFCVGFGLAFFLDKRAVPTQAVRYGLLAIALTAFFALVLWLRANLDTYWTGHWMLGIWNPLMAVVIGAIMFALLEPLKGLHWLGSRFMVWMGDISFGIYLWHFPLLLLLQRSILKQWDTPLLSILALLITLAGTLLLASLSYYCVEKPIMQRK